MPDLGTKILVEYTFYGDANLDRTVDTLDFNILASNFGHTGVEWDHADFNYDGQVDTLDFNALASNFGQSYSGGGGMRGAADGGGGDDGWQQLVDFAIAHGITPPTR